LAPILIVCESTGSWEAAIAASAGKRGLRVVFVPTLAEAAACIERLPVEAAAEWVHRLDCRRRWPVVVAVADQLPPEAAAWLREAGVVHVVDSPRRASEVAAIAVRLADRMHWPAESPAERIWNELPWADSATRPAGEHRPPETSPTTELP
jgi:hypothetical protein